MSAKKLLLIGLGDRNKFTPELMTSVREAAAREAMRLGVSNFAFASDLKDAGIDSPTALVAENVVKGIVLANRSEIYLREHNLSKTKKWKKFTCWWVRLSLKLQATASRLRLRKLKK